MAICHQAAGTTHTHGYGKAMLFLLSTQTADGAFGESLVQSKRAEGDPAGTASHDDGRSACPARSRSPLLKGTLPGWPGKRGGPGAGTEAPRTSPRMRFRPPGVLKTGDGPRHPHVAPDEDPGGTWMLRAGRLLRYPHRETGSRGPPITNPHSTGVQHEGSAHDPPARSSRRPDPPGFPAARVPARTRRPRRSECGPGRTLPGTSSPTARDAEFGYSTATAGDVDGDGFSDVVRRDGGTSRIPSTGKAPLTCIAPSMVSPRPSGSCPMTRPGSSRAARIRRSGARSQARGT